MDAAAEKPTLARMDVEKVATKAQNGEMESDERKRDGGSLPRSWLPTS
jgi:hypothetical protein